MQGLVPLTQQQITTRSRDDSTLSTPQLTRTTNPRTYTGARTGRERVVPAPIVTPPANQAATPPVVVGYNDACPPSLYVLKDKICPYHNQGCQYRTHLQNLLTRHVVRMHDPDFRQEYKRQREQVPPPPNPQPNVELDEEEFGEVPEPRLSPRSIRRRHEPTRQQQNASFGSPNSTTNSVPSPFVRTPTGRPPVTGLLSNHSPLLRSRSSSIQQQLSPPNTGPGNEGNEVSRLSNASTVHRTSSSRASSFVNPSPLRSALSPPGLTHQSTSPSTIALPIIPPPTPPFVTPTTPIASSTPLTNVVGVNPLHSSTTQRSDDPPAEEILLGSRQYDTDSLHDVHQQLTEIKTCQLGENFTMMVCGPSDSGKTVFIGQVIVNKENVCEVPPKKIVSVYCNNEPTINDLPQINVRINVNELNEQQYTAEELEHYFINHAAAGQQGANAPHSLIVFDDCQMKPSLVKAISALFNGSARHNNISLIYVGQKLFDGHEQNRISTNAKYLVLFKNSRFKNECTILNRQINPGRPGILADMLELLNPHEHLLINFEPKLRDKKLQYLTNLFQINHVVPVFVVNTAKSPLETSA